MTHADRSREEPAISGLALGSPYGEAIRAAHAEAEACGASGYTDPDSQLFVLTAAFLKKRGCCCGNGCRHCPYVSGS